MIHRLTPDTALDRALIGGKACGLVRLLRAGFDVPDAWCLPATEYRSGHDELPGNVRAALDTLWAEIACGEAPIGLAVRSSAIAEDLERASFAGLYVTRLGIESAEALCEAVLACWREVAAARVSAYREARGVAGEVAMAVVIQAMVSADVAGVLLTSNPVRPFASELAIEAAWGLGESVVAARTEPDHLVVERISGEVREQRVGQKASRVDWVPGKGMVEGATSAALRAEPCLSPARLERLVSMAAALERAFGPGQDCEWAFQGERLLVLQLRPMTDLPPLRPRAVWSRKFGDEYLAGYTTPLTQTLLVPWIAENYFGEMARLMRRADLAGLPPFRCHRGYQYFSGEYMARLLRALPPRFRTSHTQGWFTPLWQRRIADEPFDLGAMARALGAPLRDWRGRIDRNLVALDRHCRRVERELGPRLAQDYAALAEHEISGQLAEASALGREHFRVIRWGMGFYNPILHAALRSLLERWASDQDGSLYQALVSGLPDTHTAAINRALWQLARAAEREPALRHDLLAGVEYTPLRASTSGAAFWGTFDAFMARYGHRGGTREICEPRWAEAPDTVLGFVCAQLRGPGVSQDPGVAEQRAARRRTRAEAEMVRRVGTGPGGRARRLALAWVVRYAQQYTRYRENQRHHLDLLTAHVRRLVLAHGHGLVGAGVLEEQTDVFFLRAQELSELRSDRPAPPGTRARITERRRHFLTWRNRVPATFLFDGVETEGEVVEGEPTSRAGSAAPAGLGVSRGEGRGPARVVRDMRSLGAVVAGEVLVASNIDPGWTNVFPLLAGVVTETGGMLSHGALLAREYGVPAVMGVPQATERVCDGQIVEVDGTRGHVRLAVAR